VPAFESTLLSLFIAGLLGGPHCVGMCGGIVGALSGVVQLQRQGQGKQSGVAPIFLQVGYHAGRVTSYVLAGALAGGLGGALLLAGSLGFRLALLAVAGLMLLGMGLYLIGLPQMLLPLEKLGAHLWQRLQPLSRPFLPVRRLAQAFPLGLVWGWLPCGLVYTALTSALSSGNAGQGGLVMLAFGLGTLPNMLLAGLFAARMRAFMQRRSVRLSAGLAIIGFGLHSLLGVWRLMPYA
jgi:sulfite exporter TauE/SafE